MSGELRSSVFREVNDRIAEITGMWEWEDTQGFLCECAAGRCTEAVSLTRAQYEAIRALPTLFFTVPGHELADEDLVVERHEGFVVVEKVAEGGSKQPPLGADEERASESQTA